MALQPATAPVAVWPAEPAEMLVPELLGRGWLVLAHGAQGAGKTFISCSLAWHLSLGWQWRGRMTAGGTVVYCSPPEGAASIKRRFDALARSSETAAPPTLLMSTKLNLLDPEGSWDEIATAVNGAVDLVVLDYGSSLGDVSLDLTVACEKIREASGAAMLVHSENAILPPELSRGWDGDWRFERTVNDLMLMTVERLRDSATIGRLGFRLDGDGDSAVAVGTDARPVMRPQMTTALTAIFDTVQELVAEYNDYSITRDEFAAAARGLDLEALRGKPPKQVTQQIGRWQDQLVAKGLLARAGELLTVNPSWRHVRRLRDLDADEAEELRQAAAETSSSGFFAGQ